MRLVVCQTAQAVSTWAAHYVRQRIQTFAPTPDRPFVLGLPTGGTPKGMYQLLIEQYRQGNLSFQSVLTFNIDEYVGLPDNHPGSFQSYMDTHFFDHIDIPHENIHRLNGNRSDLQGECDRYESALQTVGGMELLIGGIGEEGHIGFNEPGSSLRSRTRIETLTYSTRLANARFFDHDLEQVPRQAITMGIGTMMEAREILILAQGYRKAQAVQQAIEGGIHQMCPVTALQLHPNTILVCDESATLELKVKTVKYFQEQLDHEYS